MTVPVHETAEELYTENQRLQSHIEALRAELTDRISEQRLLIDQRDQLTRERDDLERQVAQLKGVLSEIGLLARGAIR